MPSLRLPHLALSTWLAIALSLLAAGLSLDLSGRIFDRMPHIEDEMAYVWQAQVFARGQLTTPSPPHANAFLVPFVVDFHGQRFGKYPPGWPAVLALGILLHARSWVNPLLAGLGVWLTYRLGRRLFDEVVALLASLLTLLSPFFLMNSASLLSHPLGLFLALVFCLSWLDAWQNRPDLPSRQQKRLHTLSLLCASTSLGLLAITRPLTAIGVALPFAFHAVYLFLTGKPALRVRLLLFALLTGAIASILFLWQYAVTGNAFLNPYTLWWPYDKVGFGPGYGRASEGHNWHMAWVNLKYSLRVGQHDLFGWGSFSWIFLPFGALAVVIKKNVSAILPLLVLPALLFVYLFYWIGSGLFGPRYYYEGLFSATLLTAVGIAFLAGWPISPAQPLHPRAGWKKIRPLIVTALVLFALSANLFFYLPIRLGGMKGLYGVSAARLHPFQTEQARSLTPALVIVHPQRWTEYGALLDLSSPFLDSPWIFIRSIGANGDLQVAEEFPHRTIVEYFPSDPYRLKVIREPR